jgi:hypothetical protein
MTPSDFEDLLQMVGGKIKKTQSLEKQFLRQSD